MSPTFVFVWSLHLFITHFACADTHTVLTAIYSAALGELKVCLLHSCVSAVHKLEHPIVSEGTKVSVSSLCCTVVLTAIYLVALGALKVCLPTHH